MKQSYAQVLASKGITTSTSSTTPSPTSSQHVNPISQQLASVAATLGNITASTMDVTQGSGAKTDPSNGQRQAAQLKIGTLMAALFSLSTDESFAVDRHVLEKSIADAKQTFPVSGLNSNSFSLNSS